MWKLSGEAERDGFLVERVVHRVVIVGDRGIARHHHAAQAELLDRVQVGDAGLDRTHRRLPDAEQPVRVGRAVLGDPQVVGVEAGLLVLEVGMVAEHHADGRVEDLRAHAVALLVGQAGLGVPAAAVQVLEAGAEHRELLGLLAGGRDEPHGNRLVEPVDDEHVPPLGVAHQPRRAVLEAVVDAVDVRARRFGDVRVGGDDRGRHGSSQQCLQGGKSLEYTGCLRNSSGLYFQNWLTCGYV